MITVRQGAATELTAPASAWSAGRSCSRHGPTAVLWAILDKIVDDYAPVVEGLEQDVEEVEDDGVRRFGAATERIYRLRREATDFYRAVHPLLGPLDEPAARRLPAGRRASCSPFFRDVNDHLKLVNEEVLGQRDPLASCCRPTWR